MTEQHQYCTFYLHRHFFGVGVEHVQEVLFHQAIIPVPLAPPVVRGLINLRGQIITVIDLRTCLDLPANPAPLRPVNMIVRTQEGVISFLVDAIGDVVDVDPSKFEPSPETLKGTVANLTTGLYKIDNQILLPLDPNKVVELT